MDNIICPYCGSATSLEPAFIKDGHAFLPAHSAVSQKVYGIAEVSAEIEAQPPTFTAFGIFDCKSCSQRFVAKRHRSEDKWKAVYPIAKQSTTVEIPEPIRTQFDEAYKCFTVEAYLGCLLVCRTTLISIQREKKVSNLEELKTKGLISNMLCQQANEVRRWGNMLAHEDVTEPVTKEDCQELLTYIDALLDALYVQPRRLADLSQKRKELKESK